MKETPLCFGDIRINNMSRLIVFSDQFSNKKLNSISVGKVENSNMPIVLVVVTESKRDKMEKLEKLLERKPLVVLVSIGEYTREDLDQEYLLKEDIISSLKQKLGFDLFAGTALVVAT